MAGGCGFAVVAARAFGCCVVEECEFVGEGSNWFEHEEAYWCGFIEIDGEAGRFSVFGNERLNGEASLGECAAFGAKFHQHAGSKYSGVSGGFVGERSCSLDAGC